MLYIAEQSGGGLGQNQGVETPRDTCLPAMSGGVPSLEDWAVDPKVN